MANRVHVPMRKFIEQKIKDNFKDIDFRPGTAFNDLFANVAAVLQQPLRHELNMLKVNQSLLNLDYMTQEDMDAVISNFFISRNVGTRANGYVRLYFTRPGDFRIQSIYFSTSSGLKFLNVSEINTSVESLLANPSPNSDGTYYLDVLVQAESEGSKFAVKANEIIFTENQPDYIFRVENRDDFAAPDDTDTNASLYEKAKLALSVRNLVNTPSIKTVLYSQFGFVRDISVIGAGHDDMIRDLIQIDGNPSYQINTGGKTDIYVDTNSTRMYDMAIETVPQDMNIAIVNAPTSSIQMSGSHGSMYDEFFTDTRSRFVDATGQHVIGGNDLRVTTSEFGVKIVKQYNIESIITDTTAIISESTAIDSLDGISTASSNIFSDINNGPMTGIEEGDVFKFQNEFHRVGWVGQYSVELVPPNLRITEGGFTSPVEFNVSAPSRYISNFELGLGVSIGDSLHILEGNTYGQYEVMNVISNNEIWVGSNPEPSTITFGVNNTATVDSGKIPLVGEYTSVQGDPVAYKIDSVVGSAITTTVNHGLSGQQSCLSVTDIISDDIEIHTGYIVYSKEVRSVSSTIATTINDGEFYHSFPLASDIQVGDLLNNSVRVISVIEDLGSKYVQFESVWSIGTATSIQVYRYNVNVMANETRVYDRTINFGSFDSNIPASAVLSSAGIGIGVPPGRQLVIHTGAATGVYDLSGSLTGNPDEIQLVAALTDDIAEGDEYSFIDGPSFAASAHGDMLYVPEHNSSTLPFSSFPAPGGNDVVYIPAGVNKGAYDVVEYVDVHRIRISGTVSRQGESIVNSTVMDTTSPVGVNVISSAIALFSSVLAGDTVIVGDRVSYHILSRTNNSLTLDRVLEENVFASIDSIEVVRDTLNSVLVCDASNEWQVFKTPDLYSRPSEGVDGNSNGATFEFTSLSSDFHESFSGLDPAGYGLYILSGAHARIEPYIILGIHDSTTLNIDPSSALDSLFDVSGFVGPSYPSNSETFEIKKSVSRVDNIEYRIVEDYDYYANGQFFRTPILLIQSIFPVDPITGVEGAALEEGVDYTLEVKNPSLRYSSREDNYISIRDESLKFSSLNIRYMSDPNIELINDFANNDTNRVVTADTLVKRMETAMVDMVVQMSGEISEDAAIEIVNNYITTRKSTDAIEASDLIKSFYDAGANYVDTESLNMSLTYYASDGQVFTESSRSIIGTSETSTYLPGTITINVVSSNA